MRRASAASQSRDVIVTVVMAGLDPAIHDFPTKRDVGARHRRQFTQSAQSRPLRPGM